MGKMKDMAKNFGKFVAKPNGELVEYKVVEQPKPPEYIVIEEYKRDLFLLRVNYQISQGYQPIGGVSVVVTVDDNAFRSHMYSQAMLKRE